MQCDEQLPPREEEAMAALKASPLVKKVGLNAMGSKIKARRIGRSVTVYKVYAVPGLLRSGVLYTL